MPEPGGGSTTVEVGTPGAPFAGKIEASAVLVLDGPFGLESRRLRPGQDVIVGRGLPADVVLGDGSLSRLHARFAFDGRCVTVEDLESRNGTAVDGHRLVPNVKQTLLTGQPSVMGATTATVQLAAGAPELLGACTGVEPFMPMVVEELERARLTDTPVALLSVRSLDRSPAAAYLTQLRSAVRPLDRVAVAGRSRVLVLCPGCDARRAEDLGQRLVAAMGNAAVGVGAAVATGGRAEDLLARSQSLCLRTDASRRVNLAAAKGEGQTGPGDTDQGERGDASDRCVAQSHAMRALVRQAERAARAPVSVVILGETGSGKDVIARLIHRHSPRAEHRLVTVNCGAIPNSLLASTLFGHMRGSFTGASETRAGLFEQAHKGTLFLDEIGELSLDAQVSLLRVLENGRVTRVGSSREQIVDARIIAATHRDLEARVHEGTFREDLLYRLNAVTLHVCPLRERRGDIQPLTEVLLRDIAERFQVPTPTLDPHTLSQLEAYAFPGNVRELRNILEHAMVASEGPAILPQHLPDRLRSGETKTAPSATPGPPDERDRGTGAAAASVAWLATGADGECPALPFRQRIENYEISLIHSALAAASGNQTRAAEALQIPRRTLVHKLRAHRLQTEEGVGS